MSADNTRYFDPVEKSIVIPDFLSLGVQSPIKNEFVQVGFLLRFHFWIEKITYLCYDCIKSTVEILHFSLHEFVIEWDLLHFEGFIYVKEL